MEGESDLAEASRIHYYISTSCAARIRTRIACQLFRSAWVWGELLTDFLLLLIRATVAKIARSQKVIFNEKTVE